MNMDFDKDFLERLFEQAIESPHLRQSFDLRTSSADSSQRILNAFEPSAIFEAKDGAYVPITSEEVWNNE